jgi:hypothetical protein
LCQSVSQSVVGCMRSVDRSNDDDDDDDARAPSMPIHPSATEAKGTTHTHAQAQHSKHTHATPHQQNNQSHPREQRARAALALNQSIGQRRHRPFPPPVPLLPSRHLTHHDCCCWSATGVSRLSTCGVWIKSIRGRGWVIRSIDRSIEARTHTPTSLREGERRTSEWVGWMMGGRLAGCCVCVCVWTAVTDDQSPPTRSCPPLLITTMPLPADTHINQSTKRAHRK